MPRLNININEETAEYLQQRRNAGNGLTHTIRLWAGNMKALHDAVNDGAMIIVRYPDKRPDQQLIMQF